MQETRILTRVENMLQRNFIIAIKLFLISKYLNYGSTNSRKIPRVKLLPMMMRQERHSEE